MPRWTEDPSRGGPEGDDVRGASKKGLVVEGVVLEPGLRRCHGDENLAPGLAIVGPSSTSHQVDQLAVRHTLSPSWSPFSNRHFF
jgi:hypothetical protein